MMFRRLKIALIILIVLPAIVSCRAISSFLTGDEIVAQVGQDKLYRSDIDKLMPRGIAQEDSAHLARKYIRTWASDHVFMNIAQKQLSKEEKDVTRELEDYRKSLLKYRYEQLYVNERLDTSVAQDLVEAYYLAHKDKFILERPVVKARFVNIAKDSPSLKQIRKRMSSSSAEELMEADSIAFSSAIRFTTWSDKWIDVSTLAREYVMDYNELLARLDKGWIEVADTVGQVRITYVSEMIPRGKMAPLEFCEAKIKDMIISARKQNLIGNLEQDLLDDARKNGQFIIY